MLNSQRSSEALRPFVRAYAQRMTDADAPLQFLPPRLEQTLNFDFGLPVEVWMAGRPFPSPPAVVVGAHDHAGIQLRLRKGVESFSVFFRPTGFTQLFGVPLRHLTNAYAEADALLGSAVRRVWEEMGSTDSFRDRVAIVERFLIARRDVAAGSVIAVAAEELLRLHGRPHISRFATTLGVDVRQFERRFVREMGLTPKRFARVARFQTALDWKLARPDITWCRLAHELGYHDQMHLVHDFSKLGGQSPSEILGAVGDSRPPALVSNKA